MSDPVATTPAAGFRHVLVRRVVLAVAVIVIGLIPVVVFGLVSGQWAAASWAMLGMLIGLSNLTLGGRALGYLSFGLVTALTPIAIVSGAVPLAGAGLMAIMCFGVGLSASRGIHQGLVMIPLFMACMIIAPPTWSGHPVDRNTTAYLLSMMLFFGGGVLWAVLVFPPLLRKRPSIPPEPNNRTDTVIYTVIITVLCTASTLGVLIWYPGSKGAWLVVILLVITRVGHEGTVKLTLTYAAGTIVGVGIAAAVASLVTVEAVLLSIGMILLVVALVVRQGAHFAAFVAFLTPALVLFSSTSIADVPKTDAQRLAFALVAVGLALIASAVTLVWAHYQQTDTPAETATPLGAAP
jgi:hypothetical protein